MLKVVKEEIAVSDRQVLLDTTLVKQFTASLVCMLLVRLCVCMCVWVCCCGFFLGGGVPLLCAVGRIYGIPD